MQKLTSNQKPMRAEIAKYINEKVHIHLHVYKYIH